MADLSPVLRNPEPDGVHFLVEFFGCDAGSLNSMPFWKTVLIQTAEAAGLKVLNQHFFQFTPEGITGYLLLSTSHISIHTWPEHGYAACDVFSCGGDEETQEAVDSIIVKLPHQRVNLQRIKRGYRWLGYDSDGCIDYFETTRVGAPPVRIPMQCLVYKARSTCQEIVICDTEIFGRCLLLDGTIQCSERDHDLYDRTMLHRLTPSDRRLLIIGGGDGYIAATAMHLNSSLKEIAVVDLDGEVVNACRSHLHQTIFDHAGVNLVVQDVLQFMEQHERGAYDGIICDLTAFPLGYRRSGELCGFYRRVFDLSAAVLKENGWFSMYAGSVGACLSGGEPVVDMLTGLLEGNFQGMQCREEYIPCFSESSIFLYGRR